MSENQISLQEAFARQVGSVVFTLKSLPKVYAFKAVLEYLKSDDVTDLDRADFADGEWCTYCGTRHVPCHCWNDD